MNKPMMADHEIKIIEAVTQSKTVLEWGSGYSTLHFSKNAKNWVAIENNELWFNKIKGKTQKNTTLHYYPDKNQYINPFKSNKKFDVVIIDGVYRQSCFTRAFDYIKAGGVVVLHDAARAEYQPWATMRKYIQVATGEISDEQNPGYYKHRGIYVYQA